MEDGEKIPSESELADMYGVNRLTIRLALQQLNLIAYWKRK
jgi:GntR family transcriptional repressor for pyruvate dehydrogenase complex